MVQRTAGGRRVVTTTINEDAYNEIKQRGFSVGSLAEQGLRNIAGLRERNEEILRLEEGVERLQNALQAEAMRTRELENEVAILKADKA